MILLNYSVWLVKISNLVDSQPVYIYILVHPNNTCMKAACIICYLMYSPCILCTFTEYCNHIKFVSVLNSLVKKFSWFNLVINKFVGWDVVGYSLPHLQPQC